MPKRGKPMTDDWQYLENVDGEMREVKPPKKKRSTKFVSNPKDSILKDTARRIAHKSKTRRKGRIPK